ncbi:MAG: Modification methylase HaeIII [Nitrospira sp.]|nr:Modification methylase HaeIII [Nitrospira sp.]
MSSNSRHKFIDLFAGCGGFSLGFCQAGWQGIFAIEKDASAFMSFKANFLERSSRNRFDWPDWLDQTAWDIHTVLAEHRTDLEGLRGKVTAVIGGPPCQGFSFAGARSASDPRNQLFEKYVEFVRLVQPRFVLIENVGGIRVKHENKFGNNTNTTGAKGQSYAEKIVEALKGAEYCPSEELIYSKDFGVPQRRPRVIFYAYRREERVPQSAFFEVLRQLRTGFLRSKELPTDRPVCVEEAISDLQKKHGTQPCDDPESPKGFEQGLYGPREVGLQKLLRGDAQTGGSPNSHRFVRHRRATRERFEHIFEQIEEGKVLRGVQLNAFHRAAFKIGKHVVVPLEGKQVGHTLTTLPDDYIHYKEPRILTPREYARLQTFPDSFKLHGPYTTGGQRRKLECPRYTQIGNAVPPLLSEALGLTLMHILKKDR